MPGNPDAFTFLFDTGSAFTWLASTDCTNPHTNNLYKCDSTCTITDKPQNISYFVGYVAGNITYDDLTIGTLTISQMSFLNVFDEKDRENMLTDGVVGFDLASFYDPDELGIMYYLKNQSLISKGVLGVYLSSTENDSTSEIILGGYNTNFTESFEYSPTISNSSWSIAVNFYSIDSKNITVSGMTANINTAASMTYVPLSFFEEYINQTVETVVYSNNNTCKLDTGLFYCYISNENELSGFPKFQVKFLEKEYEIPIKQLVRVVKEGKLYIAIL